MALEDVDHDAVLAWRYECALELGLSADDSERFAESDGDLATLRRLVAERCDGHLAVEILT